MKKLTALGANIFAGLFTHGVRQAGYEILGHLEHGNYGVATARANFPKLEVRVGREHWKERDFKNKVNFMFCNPPCAAWSNARSGRGGTWEEQLPRLRYIHDCVDAGINIQPDVWCWESVTSAWRMGQTFVLHQAEKWNDAGYHCTVLLQDNQYLGAPQIRQRMFLIAHRYPLVWPRFTRPISVRESFAQLEGKQLEDPGLYTIDMQPLWKKRLWPMSKNYNGYFRKTFELEGRGPEKLTGRIPSVLVRRLGWDDPAPVMMAAGLRLHPSKPRYVSWHEWLTLCGLPLNWKTTCRTLDSASQELGRAVMPAVGKWLGTAVKLGLQQKPLDPRRPVTRFVDLRKPDSPIEQELFKFEGFTITPVVPPPIPLLEEKPVRAARAGGSGEPRTPKAGIGARIRGMILEGVSTEAILTTIHKEFPASRATAADVSWNRGRLRRDGLLKEERRSA